MNRHFIDYNAIPAPYVAMSDPAQTPSQIAAELEEQRKKLQAEDAKAYAGMQAPAKPTRPRDEPYQPEGFGYAHVDHTGHQGEVIPKRPETAALAPTQPAAQEWQQPAAPTEWQSGPPPERGWYVSTCYSGDLEDNTKSFFDGERFTHMTATVASSHSIPDDDWTRFWRGPRLTGDEWPEPQQ